MWRSWREWRNSVYGLEREFALGRLGQATALGFLMLALFFVEFYHRDVHCAISACFRYIGHAYTGSAGFTPAGTVPSADSTALVLPRRPVQSGMSGCIPDQIMITSPKPGDVVSGMVEITGTANVPNFGFYKYEIAPMGTQNWATVSAEREPKTDELLGKWNTLSLDNGDYFLRLVITDNVGTLLEPCVIAVRTCS